MTNRAKIPRPVELTSLTGLGPVADELWFDCISDRGAANEVFYTVVHPLEVAIDLVWAAQWWHAWSIFR